MKSKKFFLLSVATLVISLCVMVTGIFAIKSASLKMGGTLSFNMHDVIVEASGTISNVAIRDKDGSFVKTSKTISNAIMGGESINSLTKTDLDLGELQFYKGYDMIFNLTFKNLSEKSVLAYFNIEYNNSKVTVVDNGNYDTLPTSKIISSNGTTNVYFALNLSDQSTVMDGFAFSITADFEEFAVGQDSEGKHYLSMGYDKDAGAELLWYPFAKQGSDGNFTTFNATSEITSGTYYFVSKYVLCGCTADLSDCYNNVSYSINDNFGLDYQGSVSETRINGTGEDSLYAKYGFANSVLYKAIKNRDLPGETYTRKSGATATTKTAYDQRLWSLSLDEVYLLAGKTVELSTPIDELIAYDLSDNANLWWLRTPVRSIESEADGDASLVRMILPEGAIEADGVNIGGYHYRPGFQLTLDLG